MKTKILALSALSTALATIFLTLGQYIQFLDLASVLVASVFVMLPLYFKSYLASFLTFLASILLSLMFYGFNIYSLVFPSFTFFFGIYPMCRLYCTRKGFNEKLMNLIFMLWCIVAMFGIFYYYTLLLGGTIETILSLLGGYEWLFYVAYLIVSVIIYFLYDKFTNAMFFAIDKYVGKIIK